MNAYIVTRTGLLALMVLIPLAAQAEQPTMKPGKWEYNMKMDIPGMPFAMPPVKTQRCLKQDEIDRGDQYSKDDKCKVTNLKQDASSASYDVACKDGAKGHYDFKYGPDSMTGTGVTETEGQKITSQFTAKRLGDCK